jgi:Tfp pilus assembly protein PilF
MRVGRMPRVLAGVAVALTCASLAWGREGQISGKVVDESGAPIEGAAILITSPNDPSLKLELTTDSAGQFEASVQSTSWNYMVQARRDGFSPTQLEYKIPSGSAGRIDITLHPPLVPPAPKVDPGIAAYNAGVEMLQKGDKTGAEAKFRQAVAAKPDLTAAWKVLSQLSYEQKDYALALEAGRKALEQSPSEADLYGILMDSAQKTGDPQAAEYKEKFYEANADNPEVNFNAGVESYNASDYSKATSYFAKAVSLKPDLANAYFWLAMSEFNQKSYGQARSNFQKYLQLAPDGDQAANAKEMLKALPAQK